MLLINPTSIPLQITNHNRMEFNFNMIFDKYDKRRQFEYSKFSNQNTKSATEVENYNDSTFTIFQSCHLNIIGYMKITVTN